MIDLRNLDQYRYIAGERAVGMNHHYDRGKNGVFQIQRGVCILRILAASGGGWDHVSVTLDQKRCPLWDEMDFVKRLFFLPQETVMQLHPPESLHISIHPYCLHLWRPHALAIPLPPLELV